jgi:uncharacterized membrane protein
MSILSSASKIAMLAMVFWVILLTAFHIEITEPMRTIAFSIVAFYFGGKNPPVTEKE